jgi:glycosyltransferase involved in cell wall biosynthesis
MGRMQKRKRIDDLIQAFNMMNMEDVGLILVGPDSEGILVNIEGKNIFKLGPVYGEESLDLLSAADVYCLPGAIGLSIVDAFYCGLPVITEDVRHGPEITYLKNGVNGFIVPQGDISELAAKLRMLLTDDALREKFSQAAKHEIMTNGHIDRLCEGFESALRHVFKS